MIDRDDEDGQEEDDYVPIGIIAQEESYAPELTVADIVVDDDHPAHVCYPLRVDWEQTKIVERNGSNPYRPYFGTKQKYAEHYQILLHGREPFPEPPVSSRDEVDFPIPAPVLKLAELARERSWEVHAQYSQGHFPHGTTGRPGALKDVVGLRFTRHPMTDRQAYAVYARTAPKGMWAWDSTQIWGPDLPPYAGCGITELTEFLREPDRPTPNMLAWVGVIRYRREQQKAEQKARTKAAPKKSQNREGMS